MTESSRLPVASLSNYGQIIFRSVDTWSDCTLYCFHASYSRDYSNESKRSDECCRNGVYNLLRILNEFYRRVYNPILLRSVWRNTRMKSLIVFFPCAIALSASPNHASASAPGALYTIDAGTVFVGYESGTVYPKYEKHCRDGWFVCYGWDYRGKP